MTAIFYPDVEQQLVAEYFKGQPEGFFVDVGANDPIINSQTYHLEQLGWDGILIEPQPHLAESLRKKRKTKVFAVACSNHEDTGKSLPLYLAGIFSSLNQKLNVVGVEPHDIIHVPIKTLDEILAESNAKPKFELLSVDVEGYEINVLNGFNIDFWKPRLILLEDDIYNLRKHQYLKAKGYKLVRRTGVNSWYIPKDDLFILSLKDKLQLFKKYFIGIPFRNLRQQLRFIRWKFRKV